ncbi:MAG: glycosyltransferase family 4 protein, partial [Leptolyngbyaceae cyanobacterium bins.59]|nr:glycosyltransferase family 4 protein [Leptolyngbyaceae cyanobacterium bins.59]
DGKQAILWRYFPKAYFALEGLLVNQFSKILSCNSESIQLYQHLYPSLVDRINYYRNSVDTEIFYPLPFVQKEVTRRQFSQKMGLSEETRFILFAGRLHPQKDPILLVRSFAALDFENAHLLIAGDGELADEVRSEITRLGLTHKITMLGSQSRNQLAYFQQISSACVLTSAYEGLPIVVLEALASGTPIVTTRCGETPKILTAESGIVCDERSPETIAKAFQIILEYPEKFPVEACTKVAAPYSANLVIQKIYSDMLNRWKPE